MRENYKKDLSICLIRRSNQFSDIYVFEIQSAPTPISISIHKKHFSFRVLGLLQKKFTPLPYTTTKDSNQDLEAFIKQELPEGILRVLLPTEKGMEVFSVKDGWKSLKKS